MSEIAVGRKLHVREVEDESERQLRYAIAVMVARYKMEEQHGNQNI